MSSGIVITQPSLALLCKLGSLAAHAEELLSSDGHAFDRMAIEALLSDAEVLAWMQGMRSAALLPVRRK
jgi:hypothetical protein